MKKIQMQTPLVEMDGDEMTRILWKMIKEELLLPFLDLNTEYYDLGLVHRNETEDQVRMRAAANYINSGHFQEALNVLNSLSGRNGQWYFLHSLANSGMGNNVTAMESARQAVNMEPNNQQYRMLLQRLESGGGWYQSMGTGYGRGMTGDDCMQCLYMNLLCNCCCTPCC